MEPPEVQRFLRQELLKKVGHSWWNRPQVYRHDLAEEREPTLTTPSLGRGIQPPRPCGPRAAGFRHRVNWDGRERPEFWQSLPSRSGRRRRRPDPREAGPRGKLSGSRNQLCSVQAQSSDRRSHCPCAPTSQRLRSQRVMRATSQARKKIHPTSWRDLHRTWKGTRKQRSPTKRRPEGRNHRPN